MKKNYNHIIALFLLSAICAGSWAERPQSQDLFPYGNRWRSFDYHQNDLLSVLRCDVTHWSPRLTALTPYTFGGFTLAYDTNLMKTFLFFGVNEQGTGLVSETWEWDGITWSFLTNTGPTPRFNQAMVYDAERKQTVLFAGQGHGDVGPFMTLFDDTWTWNGQSWTLLSPLVKPSIRAGHSLAYDQARKETILFGGDPIDSLDFSGPYLSDTWSWNGSNWQQKTPLLAPSGRMRHPMAYDQHRQRVVLFGGQGQNGPLGDTWEWDGTSWSQITTPHSPSPRRNAAMTYDSTNQVILLYGGEVGIGFSQETWTYNGTDWTLVKAGNPPNTDNSVMTYDADRSEAILFTGEAPITTFVYDDQPSCPGN